MKRILYVEDNPDTAGAVKIILNHAGYVVDTALTGRDGVQKALSQSFDLILLDVMLPDMSGWEVYGKLKPKVNAKYAFLSAIPISQDRVAQLEKEGLADYIMKPFTKNDLLYKIKRIV